MTIDDMRRARLLKLIDTRVKGLDARRLEHQQRIALNPLGRLYHDAHLHRIDGRIADWKTIREIVRSAP